LNPDTDFIAPSALCHGRMAEYSGEKLLVLTIALIPVQVICVGLRLLVRHRSQMKFGFDDLVVVVSLMGQLALAGVIIGMPVGLANFYCTGALLIRNGVIKAELKLSGIGYHIAYLKATNPNLIILERKFRLMQAYIYVVIANLPKISILILYRRLFAPTILRLISTAMIWVLAVVIVVKILLVSFVCRPFAANWNQDIPGSKCLNMQSVSSLSTLPNIITDVVMLLLPVPVIWSLHTKLITKIQLTFTFALGSLLVCG
jgi:hypothetical protein